MDVINATSAWDSELDGQEYCEGKTFWCDKGHCCGRGKCCAYYYELWWFWLIWALIILLSCCCLYQQKRFRHRRNQSRRRSRGRDPNRSRIVQAFDAAFITPIFDPDRVRLPTYDEAKDLPKDPPPYDVLYETRLPETSVNTPQTLTVRHINEAPQASLIENEEQTAEATSSWTEPPPPYTPTSPPLSPAVTSPPYTPFPSVPSSSGIQSNSTSLVPLALSHAPLPPRSQLPSVPVVSRHIQGHRSHVNVKGQRSSEEGRHQRITPTEVCVNRRLQNSLVLQISNSRQRLSERDSSRQRSSAGGQGQPSGSETPQSQYSATEQPHKTSSSSVQVLSSPSTTVPNLSCGPSTSPHDHSSAITPPTHPSATNTSISETAVITDILPSGSPSPHAGEVTGPAADD